MICLFLMNMKGLTQHVLHLLLLFKKNGQQILYISCVFLNFLPLCTNLWVYEGPEVMLGYLQGASYTFGYYLRSCKCLNPSVCQQTWYSTIHSFLRKGNFSIELYHVTLKALSSQMDPAEIRLIRQDFIKGVLAKFARPPSSESPLNYESAQYF